MTRISLSDDGLLILKVRKYLTCKDTWIWSSKSRGDILEELWVRALYENVGTAGKHFIRESRVRIMTVNEAIGSEYFSLQSLLNHSQDLIVKIT